MCVGGGGGGVVIWDGVCGGGGGGVVVGVGWVVVVMVCVGGLWCVWGEGGCGVVVCVCGGL